MGGAGMSSTGALIQGEHHPGGHHHPGMSSTGAGMDSTGGAGMSSTGAGMSSTDGPCGTFSCGPTHTDACPPCGGAGMSSTGAGMSSTGAGMSSTGALIQGEQHA